MTWREFKEQVRVHLHVYNKTHGVQTLIETLIHSAAEDLQSAVPSLRTRTMVVPDTSITVYGAAARILLPIGSIITDLYARSTTDPTERRTFTEIPLRQAPDLQNDMVPEGTRAFIYDSVNGSLYLYPLPSSEDSEIGISYTAISSEYADSDETPFGRSEAEAVAQYCLSRLALNVESDAQKHSLYSNLYRGLKRQIMSDHNEAHVSTP